MSDWRDKARARVKEKMQGAAIKLEDGTNCLRVLPDKKDIMPDGTVNPKGLRHSPVREIRVHRDVGPDKKFNIRCGHEIDGSGKCWLCDVKMPELENSGIGSKRMQAQAMAPQDQLVVNASRFDRDANDGKGGFTAAKPWWMGLNGGQSLGVRVYSRIVGSSISKKDYISPTKGYNLNIERTGTGLKTRYPEIEGDETPSVVPKSVLLGMKDLDTVVPKYDAEDQKAAYYGRDREDGDEKPKRRREAEPEEEPETDAEDAEETEVDDGEVEAAEEEVEETDDAEAEDNSVSDDDEGIEEDEAEDLEDDLPEEAEADEEPEGEPPPPPKKKVAPAKKIAPSPAKKPAPPAAKRR